MIKWSDLYQIWVLYFLFEYQQRKKMLHSKICVFSMCCQKIDLGVSDRNFRVGHDQIQMWYLVSFILIFLIFSELLNWITSSELKMKAHLNFATKISTKSTSFSNECLWNRWYDYVSFIVLYWIYNIHWNHRVINQF